MMVLKLGTQGYICLESWNTVKMNAVLLSYKIRGIAPHPPPPSLCPCTPANITSVITEQKPVTFNPLPSATRQL